MELINGLSRKKLSEEDVYIFPVTLCDNEIDRDYEAFTVEALSELKTLFIGKTGISDHSMRSGDQSARIFSTWVEETPGRTTRRGETYTALKAKAYMVRTKKNEDVIKEIDAGIKKEVSVGCCVSKHTCSICGMEHCNHIRGKTYGGKICCTVLDKATDAYEWSFVAVPAQREAGVTKSYRKKETVKTENPTDIIKEFACGEDEKKKLCDYIGELEKEASQAREYRSELLSEVTKLFSLTVPEISKGIAQELCAGLDTASLRQLRKSLEKKKSAIFPCAPQTAKKNENTVSQPDSDYMI